MELFYYKSECGNFGDDLNAWLWPKVFPNIFVPKSKVKFIGIGTILDSRVCGFEKKIVFGSGVRGLGNVPNIDDSWEIYAVRGFLSSRALGLDPGYVITDPAVITKHFFDAHKKKVFPVSYMPYFRSAFCGEWEKVCNEMGINYIDPRSGVEKCLESIASSSCLITEAMHGAIIADAFRVPWAPIFAYNYLHEKDVAYFKWRDWLSTINVKFNPVVLPNLWENQEKHLLIHKIKEIIKINIINKKIRKIVNNEEYYLSNENVYKDIDEKFSYAIEQFKKKYSRR